MPISSLPDECFSDVLSYLDKKSLCKCLFVNRYFCKFTIPLIWREPFIETISKCFSLINTLLSCLNEDEISSLIPYAINFNNNQSPLFEYGKFIKKFNHSPCVQRIIIWLGLSHNNRDQDYRTQKLVNVIYHMMMRQGSNLQEFSISGWENTDLPKISTFTTYEPGITNLRSLKISFDERCENIIEFLNMVPKSCNVIVDCKLKSKSPFPESFVDIIKSQSLEKLSLISDDAHLQEEESLNSDGAYLRGLQGEDKKVIYALEFRSETLKELRFESFNFQDIDLSFMSKLDRLERLELDNCERFLFTKKLRLKELVLGCIIDINDGYDDNELKMMINPLLSEELYKLEFIYIVTPEMARAVGESCPNLKYLLIEVEPSEILSLAIPHICELSSLKILKIKYQGYDHEDNTVPLVEALGDNLKFVECLLLNFYIELPSFEYFMDNCKANLKQLLIETVIFDPHENPKKDYLIHVSNYQKVHNSLKLFGFVGDLTEITNEESEIIDLLKNQGVRVEFYSFYDRNNLNFEDDILEFSN